MNIDMTEMTNIANKNELLMDGTVEPAAKVIESAELVFGVFSDPDVVGGADYVVIKGLNLMKDIAAGSQAKEVGWTAIKVTDREMAYAARQLFGDGTDENAIQLGGHRK